MKRTKHKKHRRGSALATVLVFMTLMLTLGLGVLAAAQYSTVQSVALQQTDKTYYAAESAAQLAAQIFLGEFELTPDPDADDDDEDPPLINALMLKEENIDPTEEDFDLDELIEEMKDQLLSNINGVYNALKDQIEGEDVTFNGEKVTLGEFLLLNRGGGDISPLDVSDFTVVQPDVEYDEDGEVIPIVDDDDNEVWAVIVYLANPNFVITATSGGRTITVETNAETSADIHTEQDEIEGDIPISEVTGAGAYYGSKTGGIYGGGETAEQKWEKYEKYQDALEKLLDAADTFVGNKSNFVPSTSSVSGKVQNSGSTIDTDTVFYCFPGGGSANIGVAGTTTVYPNLQYIECNGLTVLGPVICPKLKGIYSSGNTIKINQGAGINPMAVSGKDADGNDIVTDLRRPKDENGKAILTNIYTGGYTQVTINCDAEVNWCVFYVGRVEINYGNYKKFTSNSIFYPRTSLNFNPDPGSSPSGDFNRVVPQFYIPDVASSVIGNIPTANFCGIIMKLGDEPVINSPAFVGAGITYRGLFVGNFDNSKESTVEPIDDANAPYIISDKNGILGNLDPPIILTGGNNDVEPETTEVSRIKDIDYQYRSKGLKLRETTGESSESD